MFYIKVSNRLFINKNDKTKVIFLKNEGETFSINKTTPGVKMTPLRSSRGVDKSRSPCVKRCPLKFLIDYFFPKILRI